MTKGHADAERKRVWPISVAYLRRRWHTRNWSCQWCSRRVHADSPLCANHLAVRSQVMTGGI